MPKPEPFGLVALDPTAAAATLPSPARAMPRPDNPHLGYAITWFGLAAALLLSGIGLLANCLLLPPVLRPSQVVSLSLPCPL